MEYGGQLAREYEQNMIANMLLNGNTVEQIDKQVRLYRELLSKEAFYAMLTTYDTEGLSEGDLQDLVKSKKLAFTSLLILRSLHSGDKESARKLLPKFRDITSDIMEDMEEDHYSLGVSVSKGFETTKYEKQGSYMSFAKNQERVYKFFQEYL